MELVKDVRKVPFPSAVRVESSVARIKEYESTIIQIHDRRAREMKQESTGLWVPRINGWTGWSERCASMYDSAR